MLLGEPSIRHFFKPKENRPTKRKRGDASTTVAIDHPVLPPLKRKKQSGPHPRRKVFDDKDNYINRPLPTSSPPNLLRPHASTPATQVKSSSAANYPTPKSTIKYNNILREPPVIDLTKDDEEVPPLSIRSPLQRPGLATPKTPVRRRRVITEIVPETPSHRASPVRPLHISIFPQPQRSTGQSLLGKNSELSCQPQEVEETPPQSPVLAASKPSLACGSSDLAVVPSSQSQEHEFDPSFFADLRARRLALENQEVIPSSQSQSQPQYWSREAKDRAQGTELQGNEPNKVNSSQHSSDMRPPSSSLKRTYSDVSFIMPIEDTDISSLFEGDPTFSASHYGSNEDVLPLNLKSLSQAVSATESDSGGEDWLQKVGDRTAIGHAISQPKQRPSQPRSSYRSQRSIEPRGFVTSRSCTPEWPSQLTLAGCDVDSSQWSLPRDATDFLDMVEARTLV
ncbi:hypothetical protein L218DRAFT_1073547 [Marasmius fiardii PR-910]|nr:hypothetical protein L218DRAFT_1073547 [Marasmius fiardii PR-910]